MPEEREENRIRLLLLDEQGLFRTSLARFLTEAGFEIAGECGGAGEVLDLLVSSRVDLVLLDFDRGLREVGEFMSAARRAGYRGGFLAVAGTMDAERSAIALSLGVSGIFLKSEPPERLVQAIHMLASGAFWIDQKIIRIMANKCLNRLRPDCGLDERQQRVILGILGGLSNRSIGDGMGVSESSVKYILQGLFKRTGVRTRSQLVRLALEGSLGNVGRTAGRLGPEGGTAGAGEAEPGGQAEESAPSEKRSFG